MKRLICKLLGHKWEAYFSLGGKPNDCGVMCARCGSSKSLLASDALTKEG